MLGPSAHYQSWLWGVRNQRTGTSNKCGPCEVQRKNLHSFLTDFAELAVQDRVRHFVCAFRFGLPRWRYVRFHRLADDDSGCAAAFRKIKLLARTLFSLLPKHLPVIFRATVVETLETKDTICEEHCRVFALVLRVERAAFEYPLSLALFHRDDRMMCDAMAL